MHADNKLRPCQEFVASCLTVAPSGESQLSVDVATVLTTDKRKISASLKVPYHVY